MSEVLLAVVDKNTKEVVHAQIMPLNSTKTINLREGSYSIYACAEGYVTAKEDVMVSGYTSLTMTLLRAIPVAKVYAYATSDFFIDIDFTDIIIQT